MNANFVIVDYATIVFIFIAFLVMAWFQKKAEVAFDEAKQTASDYSLTVLDPCMDATNPDEWQRFFARYEPDGGVIAVTVAVNNRKLTRLLLQQRQLRCVPSMPFSQCKANTQLNVNQSTSQVHYNDKAHGRRGIRRGDWVRKAGRPGFH